VKKTNYWGCFSAFPFPTNVYSTVYNSNAAERTNTIPFDHASKRQAFAPQK